MRVDDCDIVISGAGVAGLTAAAAFGTAGFSVICVDPAPPVTTATAPGADLRTTAFLQPARALLDEAGLWDRLEPFAAPLWTMRIVDAGGQDTTARLTCDFEAAEISDAPFGWNLPNWLLRREMAARLDDLPNVALRTGVAVAAMTARSESALVRLSDGGQIRARLVLAADGRGSTLRQGAGIGVKTMRYGQKALAFAVTHEAPHHNVSTEVHRFGGPFTLVPLPDLDGQPCSAVVWMAPGPEIVKLANAPTDAFEAAMNARSAGVNGALRLASARTIWPIISQIASRLSAQRLALVAEAAHVVPPIGAQGLNMSLADIRALLDLARQDDSALGGPVMLERYHRQRWPDIRARVGAIDMLNRASMLRAPMLRDLRAQGLRLLHGAKPLRRTLMRGGMGADGRR